MPVLRAAVGKVRATRLRQLADDFGHALEAFPRGECGRLIRVSGWYLPDRPREWHTELLLDDVPVVALQPIARPDLTQALADRPQAARGGFLGDLVVGPRIRDGQSFDLTLIARSVSGEVRMLAHERLRLNESLGPKPRARHLDLSRLLSAAPVASFAGVPHFHPPGRLPVLRLEEEGETHPYGNLAQEIIDKGGRVLDFGAGIQSEARLRDHVINLDVIQFPWVDVVCTCPELPFRDAIFDGVVSQAVFEHIPDPFKAARELLRVLKPGGRVLIDTAFMQPFHGDPDHYFNMTLSGLKQVMQGFEIEQAGIEPWQMPHWGLMMQIETVLPMLPGGIWRERFELALDTLRAEGDDLDRALGDMGCEALAAGVFVLARKPG